MTETVLAVVPYDSERHPSYGCSHMRCRGVRPVVAVKIRHVDNTPLRQRDYIMWRTYCVYHRNERSVLGTSLGNWPPSNRRTAERGRPGRLSVNKDSRP